MTTPHNIIGERNVMRVFCSRVHLAAVLGKNNSDLTKLRRRRQEERQKSDSFNEQKHNCARASRFFVHFFAVPAQLRREMIKF